VFVCSNKGEGDDEEEGGVEGEIPPNFLEDGQPTKSISSRNEIYSCLFNNHVLINAVILQLTPKQKFMEISQKKILLKMNQTSMPISSPWLL